MAGSGDPGYGATSRMMSEAGLCLVLDGEKIPAKKGGVYTPAVA